MILAQTEAIALESPVELEVGLGLNLGQSAALMISSNRFWTGSARTPLLASVNAGRHIVRYRIRTFMNDHGFRLRKRVKASES